MALKYWNLTKTCTFKKKNSSGNKIYRYKKNHYYLMKLRGSKLQSPKQRDFYKPWFYYQVSISIFWEYKHYTITHISPNTHERFLFHGAENSPTCHALTCPFVPFAADYLLFWSPSSKFIDLCFLSQFSIFHLLV